MSSIAESDLAKIDQQIKFSKGSLPMKFEKDDGDQNPPNIDDSIQGMGGEGAQGQPESINVAVALKGFWKFIDMMLQMIISRVDAIEYKNLSDAELTNISQQTSQVEAFQKLAVAENAPMWLSVANLIGTFGTKFSLSEEWKMKQKAKKEAEKLEEARKARKQITPEQAAILQRLKKTPSNFAEEQREIEPMTERIMEPVYDSVPVDNTEPIEVLDESERRLKAQLAAASEVTDDQMKQMRLMRRAAAIKRKHEEEEAAKRAKANINGVGILE